MTLSTIGCSAIREPEKPLRAPYSITSGDLPQEKPYWTYEDIGVFFLILVLFGSLLRLFVRFDLLPRSELNHPSATLQFALIAALSLALYLVLKLRHHRPVLGHVSILSTYHYLHFVGPLRELASRRFRDSYGGLIVPQAARERSKA